MTKNETIARAVKAKRVYTKSDVDDVLRGLKVMKTHVAGYTTTEVVAKAYDDIIELQAKGFTLTDITNTLKTTGMNITPSSLKTYIARVKAAKPKLTQAPIEPAPLDRRAPVDRRVAHVTSSAVVVVDRKKGAADL